MNPPATCYNSSLDSVGETMPKNEAARALGRLGGRKNSAAQNAARKQNAQLAGRPRRVCVECGEPVKGGHRNVALDSSCGAHGWRWEKGGTRNAGTTDRAAMNKIAKLLNSVKLDEDALIAIVRSTGRHVVGPDATPQRS